MHTHTHTHTQTHAHNLARAVLIIHSQLQSLCEFASSKRMQVTDKNNLPDTILSGKLAMKISSIDDSLLLLYIVGVFKKYITR